MARVRGFISAEAVLALIIVSFGMTLYYDSVSQLFNKKENSIETFKNYMDSKKTLHDNDYKMSDEYLKIESMPNDPYLIKKAISKGRVKIEIVERRK